MMAAIINNSEIFSIFSSSNSDFPVCQTAIYRFILGKIYHTQLCKTIPVLCLFHSNGKTVCTTAAAVDRLCGGIVYQKQSPFS